MYSTVVPPSLVPGGDIHQKSAIHYSVVGVSVLYLTPAVKGPHAVVVPPVAEFVIALRTFCHITGQKDSCAQSENIIFRHFKVQFSSSIVSLDPHCNSCCSCELCGWYPTITPSPSYSISIFLPGSPSYLTEEWLWWVPVELLTPSLSELLVHWTTPILQLWPVLCGKVGCSAVTRLGPLHGLHKGLSTWQRFLQWQEVPISVAVLVKTSCWNLSWFLNLFAISIGQVNSAVLWTFA